MSSANSPKIDERVVEAANNLIFNTDELLSYWCFMLLFAIFCCAQFSVLLSRRFLEIPIRMTIKNQQAPTEKLPLPSITFCSENPTTDEWYEKFLDNVTLPPFTTRNAVMTAMHHAVSEVTLRYEQFPNPLNTTLLTLLDQVLALNNIKPRDFMGQVSVPCDVLLSRCQLRGKVLPCGELFQRVNGQCCLFNDNADFQSSGKVFGNNLIVVTTVNYGDAYFMVHNPGAEPMPIQSFFTLNNGYYVMLYIDPIHILKSEEVHEVEEESGMCVHPDEQYLQFFDEYDFSKCATEWVINVSLALCDCAGTYYPAPDQFTCNFTQMNCLKMYPNLKTQASSETLLLGGIREMAKRKGIEIQAGCPNACEYMNYRYDLKARTLNPEHEYTGFLTSVDPKNEYVVQFNYVSQFYTVQEFVLITDWITLLSNLGGVYGLFLGCSMVTLAELVYYLWSRVISKLWNRVITDQISSVN